MDLDARFPALSDLRARARRRLPHFVWEYLDSATGTEATVRRNRAELDSVRLKPKILGGPVAPDLTTRFLGQDWAMPVGIAPVGMSGLVWPGAETALAALGARENLPYTLSTVAAALPEEVGPATDGRAWFQMYLPRDHDIRRHMLARIRTAGFGTLVLTLDVPAASRRERQVRGGLTQPVRLSPRIALQCARKPAWSLAVLRHGRPRMKLVESYATARGPMSSTAHLGYLMRTALGWDDLRWLRDNWDGPIIAKGVLFAEDAAALAESGLVEAIWVSNHAGRQFDAAPGIVEALREVRAATDLPLVADGGVEGGLDVLRLVALGADLVMLGKAWHWGLAALGPRGAAHVAEVLRRDMIANMHQIGAATLAEVPGRLG